MDKLNELEWPIIGVSDLTKSSEFYIKNLNFEANQKETDSINYKEIDLKLFEFHLILKESKIKGPIYEQSKKVIKPIKPVEVRVGFGRFSFPIQLPKLDYKFQKEFKSDKPPILYIPVPEPSKYFNTIKDKGIRFLSQNKFLGHDFEGFYVLDNENNKILFFRDYHGPYNPNLWVWTWEI